jgi:hypothetical protein
LTIKDLEKRERRHVKRRKRREIKPNEILTDADDNADTTNKHVNAK